MTEGRSSAAISSATERSRYNAAWETGDYDPILGLIKIRYFYANHKFDAHRSVLDVGCGTGATVRYHREIGGKDAWGVDFAQPATKYWRELGVDKYCVIGSAEELPFKSDSFDVVTCMDVLEHIPEQNVQSVFREMKRVGRRDFLFIIALTEAAIKMPHDGSEPHICVKSPRWWLDQIHGVGLKMPPHIKYNHAINIFAQKPCESILTLPTIATRHALYVP